MNFPWCREAWWKDWWHPLFGHQDLLEFRENNSKMFFMESWLWNISKGFAILRQFRSALNRRLGGAQPGNRFVPFVRAYARSGCLVELDLTFCWPAFSLLSFGLGELSLFPSGVEELSLFPSPWGPHPPKLLSNFSWAYRYHSESTWR